MWGIVDWGIETEQLLLQAEREIDPALASMIQAYMLLVFAIRGAYKYCPIGQCYAIDWHLASPQLRALMDNFLLAREAKNGAGKGNDRAVEWKQKFLRKFTGHKKTAGTEGALRRAVINLPELLRMRADQRGRQTQSAVASASSRTSEGYPPDLVVAVSVVSRSVLKFFQDTKLWELGANIEILGQTSTGTAPKKPAKRSRAAAAVTLESIGRLVTPSGVAISPRIYTMFDESRSRLAQSAALLGVRSYYSENTGSGSGSSSGDSSGSGSSSSGGSKVDRASALKKMKTLFASVTITGTELKALHAAQVVRKTSTSVESLSKPGAITVSEIRDELEEFRTKEGSASATMIPGEAACKKMLKPELLNLVVAARIAEFDANSNLKRDRLPVAPPGIDATASCVLLGVTIPSFLKYGIENPREVLYFKVCPAIASNARDVLKLYHRFAAFAAPLIRGDRAFPGDRRQRRDRGTWSNT